MAELSVFDVVIAHLEQNNFKAPIISFIEKNSIIFNPDIQQSEEYKKVHKEYKQMVNSLLNNDNLKLTHNEIIKAVGVIDQDISDIREAVKGIEFVLSVDDYSLFVQMMQRANIELQEQALLLILQGTRTILGKNDEDELMNIVLQRSKEEYDAARDDESRSEAEFRLALRLSSEEALQNRKEKKEVIEKSNSNDTLREVNSSSKINIRTKSGVATPGLASLSPLSNLGSKKDVAHHDKDCSVAAASAAWISSAQQEQTSCSNMEDASGLHKMTVALGNLSLDEVKQRQAFLRTQRDKLVAIKNEKRNQITSTLENHSSPIGSSKSEVHQEDLEASSKLAMRRAIAAKLKSEVIQERKH